MSRPLSDDLIDAAFKLALFPMQVGAKVWEPFFWKRPPEAFAPVAPHHMETDDKTVDAIVDTIIEHLVAGRDLGFAMMIRTNLPRRHIEDAVRAALRKAECD